MKKYIHQEDFNQAPKVRKPRASTLDPYKDTIDEWLESDKRNRLKQRHTALRVFDRLTKECSEFECSYRLVSYVAEKKRELYGESRFYMPLEHTPGEA